MSAEPDVRILALALGPVEGASSLNRRIVRDRPLLRATLDIVWDPPDPRGALDRIEAALCAFSPSFTRHECRGPAGYQVFEAAHRPRPGTQPLDGRLALAHLIEHAVIDFASSITHARRISGLTGAHREPAGRFDLMVECPDLSVGRLCLLLAVRALTGAADARPPGRDERRILATARLAYRHPGRVWTALSIARTFDWPRVRAAAALASLHDLGYLAAVADSMNFSGISRYEVTTS